jgi:hypothetical protein
MATLDLTVDPRGKRGKENAAFSGKSSERLREEGGRG